MDINFIELVLDILITLQNKKDRQSLMKSRIKRHFKNAQDNHYDSTEFFSSFKSAISQLENNIQKQYQKHWNEENQGIKYSEKYGWGDESKKGYTRQRDGLDINDYYVRLSDFSISSELQLERIYISYLNEMKGIVSLLEKEENNDQLVFPKELNTDIAKSYFKKAIDAGLMDNAYNWEKGLQLLSCFAQKMSDTLNMGKGINSDGTKRIAWKPFEELFNIKKGKLRSNFNDIQKSGCYPSDMQKVDKIFE